MLNDLLLPRGSSSILNDLLLPRGSRSILNDLLLPRGSSSILTNKNLNFVTDLRHCLELMKILNQ
jgi:hypothetical protein